MTLAASPFESPALRLRPDDDDDDDGGGGFGWEEDFSPEISASRSPIYEGELKIYMLASPEGY